MPIVKVVSGTCVKEEIKDNEKRGRESRDMAKKDDDGDTVVVHQ